MKRATQRPDTGAHRASSFEPQSGDVAVTVVTALLLLGLALVVALL